MTVSVLMRSGAHVAELGECVRGRASFSLPRRAEGRPVPEPAPSDESLMARARSGDEDAYRVLFERHKGLLEARVRRVLSDRMLRKLSVADVLQEARLVAFRRCLDFDPDLGSFRNWLLGIVDRKTQEAVRHYLGAQKRDVRMEITKGDRPHTAAALGKDPSPSQQAIAGELAEFARRALAGLSEDHREVLRLAREEGLVLGEVAKRMGRSREAAKKLYGRALTRFRELFEDLRGGSHG